jgi:hypothetical protein
MAKNENVVNGKGNVNENNISKGDNMNELIKPSTVTLSTPVDVMTTIANHAPNSKGKYEGVKAVTHHATRKGILLFASEIDKVSKGKLLISDTIRNYFNEQFENFNFANTTIIRGNHEGTFGGHMFKSKAGSCDLGVLFASYENMTTHTIVNMMLNHYGKYTKQATVKALIKKVDDHCGLSSRGNCYYYHADFKKRLTDNNLFMTSSQIEALGLLGNELRDWLKPVFNKISKAVDAIIESDETVLSHTSDDLLDGNENE